MAFTAGDGGGGQVLELAPDQLKLIVSALQETAQDLETSRAALGSVDASSFGGSWMGGFVQEHSQKAYVAVSEALADNATALQHYEAALVQVEKDAQAANDASEQATAATAQRLEVVNQQVGLGTDCSDAGAGDPTATCTP